MTTARFEGGREMEAQLQRLATGTARGAGRRALRKAAMPLAEMMQGLAPVLSGDLAESILVTSKLARSQAAGARQMFPNVRSTVVLHVGPGTNPQAITQEFGTSFHEPQPFVRPAWDADHMDLLERLKQTLWEEITKTIARAESRGTL
ncbi:MAG: HK97-gp10 family putative phage morphogenesis protein [Cypionkella sp.]|nr:HK97-gp10 family putative phage morphogenesis protein [Cypionkella sp.]